MEDGGKLESEDQIEQLVILFVLASLLIYVGYNCLKFVTGGYRLIREEDIEEVEHDFDHDD